MTLSVDICFNAKKAQFLTATKKRQKHSYLRHIIIKLIKNLKQFQDVYIHTY